MYYSELLPSALFLAFDLDLPVVAAAHGGQCVPRLLYYLEQFQSISNCVLFWTRLLILLMLRINWTLFLLV